MYILIHIVPLIDNYLKINTVDGFIFVGTNFRGLNKNETWGSKFVAMVFSFIIHTDTENYYFVGTRILGSDPQRKFVPREIQAIHSNISYGKMTKCNF